MPCYCRVFPTFDLPSLILLCGTQLNCSLLPMATNTSSSRQKSTSDILTNLSNLLPTGTFIVFQAVVPLFTNTGSNNITNCHLVERIMTGILTLTFGIINWILTFTDSITTTGGKHYYGLVTCYGLYNPQFKTSGMVDVVGSTYVGDPSRFKASIWDLINAILGVVVFATLVLLTQPVSACFWPNVPTTLTKTVPILIGIIASVYFSFAPTPRRGVGYSVAGFVNEPVDDTPAPVVPDSTNTGTATANAPTATPRSLNMTALRRSDDVAPDASRESLLTPQQQTANSTSPEHPLSVVTS